MAQIELMLRMIKDRKIVGYMTYYRGEMAFSPQETFPDETQWIPLFVSPIRICPPVSDFLELGIKVDNQWFFDGDLVDYGDGESRKLSLYVSCLGELEHAKYVGNIHEK